MLGAMFLVTNMTMGIGKFVKSAWTHAQSFPKDCL